VALKVSLMHTRTAAKSTAGALMACHGASLNVLIFCRFYFLALKIRTAKKTACTQCAGGFFKLANRLKRPLFKTYRLKPVI
jgi:hypothetical protein